MSRTAAIALLSAGATLLLTPPALAGAEGPVDKLRELAQERSALTRQNALLKREAEIAATKEPYILFDPAARTLAFKVRGRTMKSYQFSAISQDEKQARPAHPEEIFRALEGLLTVQTKEGGHPELIPPDPETGREAGLLYSDPNQLASQTGAVPVRSDAGVLGVDVPSEYFVSFDEDVVFHIRNPKTLSFKEKASERLGEVLASLGNLFSGWRGSRPAETTPRPRLSLWLTTDVDTAKHLHYSLLPGERVLIVPPPPPPVVLVARK